MSAHLSTNKNLTSVSRHCFKLVKAMKRENLPRSIIITIASTVICLCLPLQMDPAELINNFLFA